MAHEEHHSVKQLVHKFSGDSDHEHHHHHHSPSRHHHHSPDNHHHHHQHQNHHHSPPRHGHGHNGHNGHHGPLKSPEQYTSNMIDDVDFPDDLDSPTQPISPNGGNQVQPEVLPLQPEVSPVQPEVRPMTPIQPEVLEPIAPVQPIQPVEPAQPYEPYAPQPKGPGGLAIAFENALETFERRTNIGRERLMYGALSLLVLYVAILSMSQIIVNFVGFLYPAWGSVKALRSPRKEDDTLWLMYWVIFAVFSVLDFSFMSEITFYWLLKISFLLYLYLPSTQGALVIYTKVIDPLCNLVERYLPKEMLGL